MVWEQKLQQGGRVTSAAPAAVTTAPVPLTRCRICGNTDLLPILSLGDQELTGVFPRTRDQEITKGPLELVWCQCGLLQLGHTYPADEMYGQNYGYRSGLNTSMVNHLTDKAQKLAAFVNLQPGDVVLDIGSNDATLLKAFPNTTRRIGVDPIFKFHDYYPDDIYLIPEFFTGDTVGAGTNGRRPRLITSIAMFYDLPDPAQFVQDIEQTLADDGIWHLEMGYMPAMLRNTAYDAICHEHLEFYSFTVINDLLAANGMKVIDVELNDVNGGSFAVTAAKTKAPYTAHYPRINRSLLHEMSLRFDTPAPFQDFQRRVHEHRDQLRVQLGLIASEGKTVLGYGASTKGNVMLQFCGITEELLPAIAEVNEDKFGCFTPGTGIPIISETEAAAMRPDYYLVFPWHFKAGILQREAEFRARGGKLIFPLPEIEIV